MPHAMLGGNCHHRRDNPSALDLGDLLAGDVIASNTSSAGRHPIGRRPLVERHDRYPFFLGPFVVLWRPLLAFFVFLCFGQLVTLIGVF